jgi:hypothetical protein
VLSPTRRRKPLDVKLVLVSLAIALGLVMIGYGVLTGVTGDDVTKLPSAIESIDPRPDAVQVPSQTTIVVDLEPGYTGRMIIDGVAYETYDPSRDGGADPDVDNAPTPGEQVDIPAGVVYDEGRATLTFIPGEEVGFDEFAVGNHIVGVIYWKLEDEVEGEPPSRVQSYSWTFNIV